MIKPTHLLSGRIFPGKPAFCFVLFLVLVLFVQSCAYSIIVTNKHGAAEPDPLHHEMGFYMMKKKHEIDTVANLKLLDNEVMVVPSCETGGFHSIEYKVTFWDLLRNTFTFGKKRAIHIKYVCTKDPNQ